MTKTILFTFALLASAAAGAQTTSCGDQEIGRALARPETRQRNNPTGTFDRYEGRNENGMYCEAFVRAIKTRKGLQFQLAVRSFYGSGLVLTAETVAGQPDADCRAGEITVRATEHIPLTKQTAGTDRTFKFTLGEDNRVTSVHASYTTFGLAENQSGATVCTLR